MRFPEELSPAEHDARKPDVKSEYLPDDMAGIRRHSKLNELTFYDSSISIFHIWRSSD
jgi:hypothetical protein